MTEPASGGARSIVERLVPEAFADSHRSPVVSTFLRGVTTGALVGAAIAGSALCSRYRRNRSAKPANPTTPARDANATTRG
jgi:hypothetical protein